ncbi:hypothetical protein H0H92_000904 [Tricholoma furcatifolium]|nr:hypothetical protein H0H92_000904 [Tricholoma furcatifolium]
MSAEDNELSSSPQLSRSGLLQPRSLSSLRQLGSYVDSLNRTSPNDIRKHTMELSNMSFSSASASSRRPSIDDVSSLWSFRELDEAPDSPSRQLESAGPPAPPPAIATSLASPKSTGVASTHSKSSSDRDQQATPKQTFAQLPLSGISLLRHEYESTEGTGSATPTGPGPHPDPESGSDAPGVGVGAHRSDSASGHGKARASNGNGNGNGNGHGHDPGLSPDTDTDTDILTESTPLLRRVTSTLSNRSRTRAARAKLVLPRHASASASARPATANANANAKHALGCGREGAWTAVAAHAARVLDVGVRSVPAVLLGCLLNILDGVSYGMILFPATGVFAELGPIGVSMFFLSATLAQLVYTLGGSGFPGANGSMMIEVVPFFHVLANKIAAHIGEGAPKEILATTLAAYSLSAILTGLTFFALGALKLGVLIGFFPRHILVGCIGGVGAFLLKTGFTVSMRIDDDAFRADWRTFEMMFLDAHNLVLWGVPLVLAVLLRVVTHWWRHQLVFPIYFLVIPVLFYVVVAVCGLDLWELRRAGWVFDLGTGESEKWYKFYDYWAVSLDENIDTDKELVAHGYSNLLSACFGSVPNYLVYVNTLLFYRVGGGNRIAGFLLAIATGILLVLGTGPIAYIPVMVIGALIFVLGIDLLIEALWDPRHRASRTEYITILSIVVFMTVWDFVVGVIFGIIASWMPDHDDSDAFTVTLRPSPPGRLLLCRPKLAEEEYTLHSFGRDGHVDRFLFFGTITHVEDAIREIIDGPAWQSNPVRFLVLDFSLVAGVDMSSSEAFVRIHRFMSAKAVTIVFCGFPADSAVANALTSVGVLGSDNVEHFVVFNDAMEWTENAYLRAWYMAQKYEATSSALTALPGRRHRGYEHAERQPSFDSFVSSPRRSYMRDVGNRTIANENSTLADSEEHLSEPQNTLVKAFSSYGDVNLELFQPISDYLERVYVPEGHVLWKQGDFPTGLYIVESGVLRASYKFAAHLEPVEESMVPGTVAGELSALSALPRNATVVVEHDATLWKLSMDNLNRLEVEQPKLSRYFLRLVLKAAKIDHDILLSALASRQ